MEGTRWVLGGYTLLCLGCMCCGCRGCLREETAHSWGKDLGFWRLEKAAEWFGTLADLAVWAQTRIALSRAAGDVDILGHIFGQSITDLERFRQSLTPSSPPASVTTPPLVGTRSTASLLSREDGDAVERVPTNVMAATTELGRAPAEARKIGRRRKQEGAVYTPTFITRYLVEQAQGGVLENCAGKRPKPRGNGSSPRNWAAWAGRRPIWQHAAKAIRPGCKSRPACGRKQLSPPSRSPDAFTWARPGARASAGTPL